MEAPVPTVIESPTQTMFDTGLFTAKELSLREAVVFDGLLEEDADDLEGFTALVAGAFAVGLLPEVPDDGR